MLFLGISVRKEVHKATINQKWNYEAEVCTVERVVEGQHEEVSCEDGDVVPHQVLFQGRCRRRARLVYQLHHQNRNLLCYELHHQNRYLLDNHLHHQQRYSIDTADLSFRIFIFQWNLFKDFNKINLIIKESASVEHNLCLISSHKTNH